MRQFATASHLIVAAVAFLAGAGYATARRALADVRELKGKLGRARRGLLASTLALAQWLLIAAAVLATVLVLTWHAAPGPDPAPAPSRPHGAGPGTRSSARPP